MESYNGESRSKDKFYLVCRRKPQEASPKGMNAFWDILGKWEKTLIHRCCRFIFMSQENGSAFMPSFSLKWQRVFTLIDPYTFGDLNFWPSELLAT